MMVKPLAFVIRARKLGILIQDARQAMGRSLEECAQAIGVSPEVFQRYELGEDSPSLPELEALAFELKLPVDHFWGNVTLAASRGQEARLDLPQIIRLRQRIVGVLVRKARQDANLSLEDLARELGVSSELLESYEMGESPIPLPILEVISSLLDRSINEFRDQHGPVGAWLAQQRAAQGFMALTPDLQEFVSKPVNRPYLELAQRLSEMSVDKLRAVAEGLLEITY